MTDEKRVVRVGVRNIRVLLQAKLQRTALLPEAIGECLAKRLRTDGKVAAGSDANAPAALTSATNATAALRAAARSRPAIAQFGGERRDVGMKSGDLAQQIRRPDRVCALAAEDGEREGTDAPMGRRELGRTDPYGRSGRRTGR